MFVQSILLAIFPYVRHKNLFDDQIYYKGRKISPSVKYILFSLSYPNDIISYIIKVWVIFDPFIHIPFLLWSHTLFITFATNWLI